MRINEAVCFLTEAEADAVTVSAIKAQTGTKEKLDNWLKDFGMEESPPLDELVVMLTVKDGSVEYGEGDFFDEMVYVVETSSWELSMIDGDYGNKMLVGNFMSTELGKLQDHYLDILGDDHLEAEEGDVEFEIVLCSDVSEEELDNIDMAELKLSFSTYIPSITFQENVVGVMSVDQFLQLSNGLPIINDREIG